MTDKSALYTRCRAFGAEVPETTRITNVEQLESFARTTSFPVVAKRAEPSLLPSGRRARSTQVIHGRGELLRLDTSSLLLLQEYIPADHSEDWLFHAYCDAASECLVAFTGRKLRSFPTGAGETALGRSVSNPTLERQARSLLRQLGYCGAVSLDYRFDRRDGTYKLLDFNPRVGAIFRLFQTDLGVDVIRSMHLDLTGRAVPVSRPVDGRVVIVEGYDLCATWSHLRARSLTAHQLWSSWRTVRETAWLAPDDIVPAFVALALVIGRAVHPRRGRRWRHVPPRYLPGRAGADRR